MSVVVTKVTIVYLLVSKEIKGHLNHKILATNTLGKAFAKGLRLSFGVVRSHMSVHRFLMKNDITHRVAEKITLLINVKTRDFPYNFFYSERDHRFQIILWSDKT